MKTIPLCDLVISPNRQRRTFNEASIIELADSILSKGLLHAPVLRNDGRTLVAGERRIRAIEYISSQSLPFCYEGIEVSPGATPFVTLGDLSEELLYEAELEENTHREDLSWQEKAAAISALHNLRISQHGEYSKGNPEGWSAKSTATELLGHVAAGSQIADIRTQQLIAQNLDDPEVAKAKTSKEAIKIIKKKAEATLRAQLAVDFETENSGHSFYHGSFVDHLPRAGTVDVIVTDPPYGIGANTFGDQAGAAHEYDDSYIAWQRLMLQFATASGTCTKPQAHLYAFCDPRRFTELGNLLSKFSWDVWPTPLIWDKGNQGMLPRPEHGPRRCYETILYAIKGNKTVNAVHMDVIDVPGLQTPKFGAEKPVALYENLLLRSVSPGELVWDPFVGAGPIFQAANRYSVKVHGTELIEEKFHYAQLRMEDA
jgi:site-specific DNA-methyltransferase (adenine-specific)